MAGENHYILGSNVYEHKGRKVISSVGSSQFDEVTINADTYFNYEIGYIPAGYEHRPDLISNLFYDTPNYWWLILLVNNISDPLQGLNGGDKIFIPKI